MNVSYALEDDGEEDMEDSNLWFKTQEIWGLFRRWSHYEKKRFLVN